MTFLLLMVQKSGDHLLRLVVCPIIYKVFFAPSQVVIAGISEPSTVSQLVGGLNPFEKY